MDFYITDAKSGMRALVKAGYNSKVIPLIDENVLVNTTHRNRELSSTLSKWLEERNLSPEAHMIRLEEGYFSTISHLELLCQAVVLPTIIELSSICCTVILMILIGI